MYTGIESFATSSSRDKTQEFAKVISSDAHGTVVVLTSVGFLVSGTFAVATFLKIKLTKNANCGTVLC